jgi:hypothetical protein
MIRNLSSVSLLCLGVGAWLSVGCAGGQVRGADQPLSPAAAAVQVVGTPDAKCKKLGTVHGIGETLDEKSSSTQAENAAKEEAVKLGGDTLVFVTQTADAKAGSGGTMQVIDKTAEVYSCKPK